MGAGLTAAASNSSEFAEDLLELVETFFSGDPARGLQCAARKSFAAARCVAQRDSVREGIKTNFMRAGNRTRAIGTEADGSCVTRGLHLFRQYFQRAAR